jgi:hypothetical protein
MKLLKWALAALGLFAATVPVHAKFYVNRDLGDVKPENQVQAVTPKPVQIIFNFQTSGAANNRATKYAKPIMIEAMKPRAIFADFVEVPTKDGALLSIDFNNIPEKGAGGKGFATGLTFGLKGLFVTDFYEVTFKYVPANGEPTVTKVIKHALHLKMGKKDVADPGIQMKNADEAVRMVIAQVAAQGLNELAKDAAFGQPIAAGGPATLPPPAKSKKR